MPRHKYWHSYAYAYAYAQMVQTPWNAGIEAIRQVTPLIDFITNAKKHDISES
jgi:hypothetical protein